MGMGNEYKNLRADGARIAAAMREIRQQLPREDRQLLALWEAGQVSPRNLAGVLGCHHATIYRRLRKIRARLASFAVVMVARRGHELKLLHYTVAVRRYLWGRKNREIANELGLSRRELSHAAGVVKEWLGAQKYRKGDES